MNLTEGCYSLPFNTLHTRQISTMPSAKEEVGRAKALLGWGDNDPQYINWRNGIRAWAQTNKVAGKRAAGDNLWGQLKTFVESETGMPVLGRRLLQGGDADLRKKAEVAFDNISKKSFLDNLDNLD